MEKITAEFDGLSLGSKKERINIRVFSHRFSINHHLRETPKISIAHNLMDSEKYVSLYIGSYCVFIKDKESLRCLKSEVDTALKFMEAKSIFNPTEK